MDSQDLTLIGIGSSAGGIEAIKELVLPLTPSLSVAYVIVQHVSPGYVSFMTDIVARLTDLRVKEVVDGTALEKNVVYVTPPSSDVVFQDGELRLLEPRKGRGSPKPSVNRFFESIARSHGANSMGIILSGTGSDGAYGVQAIREVGGITIAQDPETAGYDGMPKSAIQTGCVDLVLSPSNIGNHLGKILSTPRDLLTRQLDSIEESPIDDLLQILLASTRVDFREYKPSMIARRIERRMVALGITEHEEYADLCRESPQAVDALFKDLLISVTRFFRNSDEFEGLRRLLPDLIKRSAGPKLRVWVAGCATGEEVYSVAMLLAEAFEGPVADFRKHVQIFATDIDSDALDKAREGEYSQAALDDIAGEYRDKYTVTNGEKVCIVEGLRNAVLFSDHNVCQDPPFQKVDLICCRNLLIYFNNRLQRRVLSSLHYALAQDGVLFLGTAETIAGSEDLFSNSIGASHIYSKRTLKRPGLMPYYIPEGSAHRSSSLALKTEEKKESVDRLFFNALLRVLGDRALLVAENFSIARVLGDISEFIHVTEDTSLRMHVDLLRSPFREEARTLVSLALRGESVRSGLKHPAPYASDKQVRLTAYPIVVDQISERVVLIAISEVPSDLRGVSAKVDMGGENEVFDQNKVLEHELESTREALQQIIEELETSNEELQSVNEEMQSTNEELQAANEELETSNEELQSTNEELITVNEELQVTAGQLSLRTSELSAVLLSTPIPIVVVDRALQVVHATRLAVDKFKIRRPGTNPHISQCELPPGYPALAAMCIEATKLGNEVVQTFQTEDHSVALTVAPYFDDSGSIQGATVTDVSIPIGIECNDGSEQTDC